jgi:large subunit ribosomal protein L20
MKLAEGYFLTKSKLNRSAQEAVEKALRYGYVGRRRKKRDFRSLWIVRINAAAKANGISYSRFMDGLKKAGIELNRKVLSDIATQDIAAFKELVEKAKAALPQLATA